MKILQSLLLFIHISKIQLISTFKTLIKILPITRFNDNHTNQHQTHKINKIPIATRELIREKRWLTMETKKRLRRWWFLWCSCRSEGAKAAAAARGGSRLQAADVGRRKRPVLPAVAGGRCGGWWSWVNREWEWKWEREGYGREERMTARVRVLVSLQIKP